MVVNAPSAEATGRSLERALRVLTEQHLAVSEKELTGGRSAERWWAVQPAAGIGVSLSARDEALVLALTGDESERSEERGPARGPTRGSVIQRRLRSASRRPRRHSLVRSLTSGSNGSGLQQPFPLGRGAHTHPAQ